MLFLAKLKPNEISFPLLATLVCPSTRVAQQAYSTNLSVRSDVIDVMEMGVLTRTPFPRDRLFLRRLI